MTVSQWNSLAMSKPALAVRIVLASRYNVRRDSSRLSSPYQAMVRRA
jgi:hypothetical protein